MAEDSKEALARYLVETYSDQLLRLAWSILGSVHDAQDICQEVLMKRLAHPGPFESRAHERAWLTRVTINLCKNLRRSLSRRPTVPLDSVAEQPVFQPEEGSLLAEVQQLPEQYRQVIVLYYYMGYDTNEIARLLSCRPATVRTRMKRAREALKQRLEELEDESISH